MAIHGNVRVMQPAYAPLGTITMAAKRAAHSRRNRTRMAWVMASFVSLLIAASAGAAQDARSTLSEPGSREAVQAMGRVPVASVDVVGQPGPTACVGSEAHRFDFWPGTWDVESRRRDASGTWHETRNRWHAETVLGGCAFVDYTDGDFGTGRFRGMGTRYYDPDADRWFITWLSTENPGSLGRWEGGFDADGAGEFFQEVTTNDGVLISRIRWWDIRAESVEWEHAISRDEGATWVSTWRMTLRRTDIGPGGVA